MSHPGLRTPTASDSRGWQTPIAPPRATLARRLEAPVHAVGSRVDWLGTLQAKGRQPLSRTHLRHLPVGERVATLHMIALDTSGSMRQGGRLARAKGYAARLIEQAAQRGEQVSLLCFGGQGVELMLPPGPARAAGSYRLRSVGGGGGTPLSDSLLEAERLLRTARRRQGAGLATCLWLLTDGRSMESPDAPQAADQIIVVDFDDPLRAVGRCAAWARSWLAEHRHADALSF